MYDAPDPRKASGNQNPRNGKFCPHCGVRRTAKAKFCTECGKPQSDAEAAPLLHPPEVSSPAPAEAPAAPPASSPGTIQAPESSGSQPAASPSNAPGAPPAASAPASLVAQLAACNHCGHKLPDEAAFCPRCGTPQAELAQEHYQLSVLDAGQAQRTIRLDSQPLVIGKAAECGLVIEGDDFLSRRHARISRRDGSFLIEDLASSNGVFIRVLRPTQLQPGDEILLGKQLLRLEHA